MRDMLLIVNAGLLLAVAVIAGRYLYLMQHGYCLSLYRPD
jgi:hypothetical protein